jgi:hypothetical protein
VIIRVLRRSVEGGTSPNPGDRENQEPGRGAAWSITAERGTGASRRDSITLSGWPDARPEAFAAVTEGILEFFDAPEAILGAAHAMAADDGLVVSRGLVAEGTEASAMSAAREGVLAEIAARRIASAVIGRRVVAGRVELLLVRVGATDDPPPAETTSLFQELVTTGYRVTGADMRRPAHDGGPALR